MYNSTESPTLDVMLILERVHGRLRRDCFQHAAETDR